MSLSTNGFGIFRDSIGELGETAQRRVARAEVVDRQPDTELAQALHGDERAVASLNDARLGYFDHEAARVDAVALQCLGESFDQPLVGQLRRGEVEPDAQLLGPAAGRFESLVEDESPELDRQPRLLGNRQEVRRAE